VERPGDVLDEVEAILIHLFEPRLNMKRGNWKNTIEYFQYIGKEDEIPLTDDEDDEE
jgi:hypothetical protein